MWMTNQAMCQKREATKLTKKAVNAMNKLPYCRVVVRVAPIIGPRDQLVHVPRWTVYCVVALTPFHNVEFAIMKNEFSASTKRSLGMGQVNVKFRMRETGWRQKLEGAAGSRLYTRSLSVCGCTLVVGAVPNPDLYVYENGEN